MIQDMAGSNIGESKASASKHKKSKINETDMSKMAKQSIAPRIFVINSDGTGSEFYSKDRGLCLYMSFLN
jgi:hypothetical protein